MTEYAYHHNLCTRSCGEGRRGRPPCLPWCEFTTPLKKARTSTPRPLAGEGGGFTRRRGEKSFSRGDAEARRKARCIVIPACIWRESSVFCFSRESAMCEFTASLKKAQSSSPRPLAGEGRGRGWWIHAKARRKARSRHSRVFPRPKSLRGQAWRESSVFFPPNHTAILGRRDKPPSAFGVPPPRSKSFRGQAL
jgi:hypothetical protein